MNILKAIYFAPYHLVTGMLRWMITEAQIIRDSEGNAILYFEPSEELKGKTDFRSKVKIFKEWFWWFSENDTEGDEYDQQ